GRSGHDVGRAVVKGPGPREGGVRPAPIDGPQIVDGVGAGDDQDPLVPQRCKGGAQLEVVVERLRCVDGELQDGNVGGGEGVHQHAPGPVVDPPAVGVETDPGGLDEVGDLLG